MNKTFQTLAWVLFAAVVIGALIYGFSQNSNNQAEATVSQSEPQKVEILKYSDYQCPACKIYIPLQEQLKRDFGDNLTIEYRHFPLSGHQFAELAARSTEAARNQGHFKEMHDMIFEGQETWSQGNARSIFFEYAEEIGLDMDRFEEDIDSEEVRNIVQRQKAEGQRRMVNATPTFFINGQRLRQNPQSYEQFKSIVEMYMYR